MATIQLYRSDISLFATAVAAIANAVPSPPVFTTAGTTSASSAAVFRADSAGSFFVVIGNLFYDATTGKLVNGSVYSIEYHGQGASAGSFASFGFYSTVANLLTPAIQADPVGALFGTDTNLFISDSATLTAPGRGNTVQVGGTVNSRIDAGAGTSTAVFSSFRSDAALAGGGGDETATVAGITTQLVSTEQIQFLDGRVIEIAGSPAGQVVLAFKAIFGRLPDAINAGGYVQAGRASVFTAATQMLSTAEAQASTGNLDNRQFVARVYGNLLGRLATDNELATLDRPGQTRAGLVFAIATSSEAATATAGLFAGSGVFAASPGAVDVLRAYEVLLGRLPEASSLAANAAALDNYYSFLGSYGVATKTLPDLYRQIQSSAEFAGRAAGNPYGITASSSYGDVYNATHGDALTATNLGLITAAGGIRHLAG